MHFIDLFYRTNLKHDNNKKRKIYTAKLMHNHLLNNTLPWFLLITLVIVVLITIFTQADQYSITVDEFWQDAYGRSVLSWYMTLGKDNSFLGLGLHMPQHGAIFEVLVALAQRIFGNPWHTRAIVNGLAGLLGIIGIALCGLEICGPWGAFLAALGLWLYPRFTGAMFNNSKDVPFTTLTIFVFWSLLLLIRKWEIPKKYLMNSILVGFLLGVAIAIRVNAIFWYPLLGLLFFGYWYSKHKLYKGKPIKEFLRKPLLSALLICSVSLVTTILLWPYVALNPIFNFADSIIVMGKYTWDGPTLFAGKIYYAHDLPRIYTLIWLIIGSPLQVIICAIIACCFVCVRIIKGKGIPTKITLLGLAFLLPLSTILLLHPVLYDTLRQFLFLVPFIILMSVYGFLQLYYLFSFKKQIVTRIVLVLVMLLSQGQVFTDMIILHPYEYIYFSPLVGGIQRARGQYDLDYWGECIKPASTWLINHYKEYINVEHPTINTPYDGQVQPYLSPTFAFVQHNPDFYISMTRLNLDDRFPSYKVIHTEGLPELLGYAACVIKYKS
jgi:hypothetical protein